MDVGLISIILFGSLILFLALGVQVAFAMGGISLVLGFVFWNGLPSVDGFVLGAFSSTTQSILTALPLYIFMAAILMYSNIADDLYEFINVWFGRFNGGLAAGTTVISSIFAAMVGIVSVSTATLGLVARPSMLKRGYEDKLTLGVIMAGGVLGVLIPPSIVMIIYASEASVSTGALFMAGIIPGLVAAAIFVIYAFGLCFLRPEYGPKAEEKYSWRQKFKALKGVILPFFVIALVLGTIYLGIATPTEAGAVGVVGAMIAAITRRQLKLDNIKKIFIMTAQLNGMMFWILIGAVAYARIVSVSRVGNTFAEMIAGADINRWLILIVIMFLFLLAGMIVDTVAALLITAPLLLPLLETLNFDLVWFGVLFVIATCIGNLSPPFGISIFVMKGVASDVSLRSIYSAVWPFICLLLIVMALVMIFPQLALWLPEAMVD